MRLLDLTVSVASWFSLVRPVDLEVINHYHLLLRDSLTNVSRDLLWKIWFLRRPWLIDTFVGVVLLRSQMGESWAVSKGRIEVVPWHNIMLSVILRRSEVWLFVNFSWEHVSVVDIDVANVELWTLNLSITEHIFSLLKVVYWVLLTNLTVSGTIDFCVVPLFIPLSWLHLIDWCEDILLTAVALWFKFMLLSLLLKLEVFLNTRLKVFHGQF